MRGQKSSWNGVRSAREREGEEVSGLLLAALVDVVVEAEGG